MAIIVLMRHLTQKPKCQPVQKLLPKLHLLETTSDRGQHFTAMHPGVIEAFQSELTNIVIHRATSVSDGYTIAALLLESRTATECKKKT